MKILLVSATKSEIEPLVKFFKNIHQGKFFSGYRFGKHSIDVLITGAGMTATAFHLGKTLNKNYDLAINAGIAGSFRKDITLGSVVNVVSDCFADLGAENGEQFLTAKEIGLVSNIRYKVVSHRFTPLENIPRGKSVIGQLPKVKGITVNTVHGNTASIKKAIKKFNPDIETMEGAAFFYACKREGVRCLQLRTISNYVEKRNKKKWKMNLAIENLNSFLAIFLTKV